MPIADPSLPIPDSFTPPKGTTELEIRLSLTPTCVLMPTKEVATQEAA